MKFIDTIKELISSGEVKESSKNLLEDAIGAVLGDPVSIGKIIIAVSISPFFLREQLFWMKMEAFLNGVYIAETDRSKMRAKLMKDGKERDNSLRLVETIDQAETQQKIQYLINATRCFLTDFIDRPDYFRICHSITHNLEEDLIFLGAHINETNLPYSIHIQGLLSSGLMYQSVLDGDGDQKYSFTPLADMVDQYAVSYDNTERYPNPLQVSHEFSSPAIEMPGMAKWEDISQNEIDDIFR